MRITRLYISFGRDGEVNHVSFYREREKASNEVWPVTSASSQRVYQILRSDRIVLESIRGSYVSGLAEGRYTVLPVEKNDRMAPTDKQLMMDSIGHYLDHNNEFSLAPIDDEDDINV